MDPHRYYSPVIFFSVLPVMITWAQLTSCSSEVAEAPDPVPPFVHAAVMAQMVADEPRSDVPMGPPAPEEGAPTVARPGMPSDYPIGLTRLDW